MFEDPSEGAEDKMSDALGCVLVGAALVVLLVIGVIHHHCEGAVTC